MARKVGILGATGMVGQRFLQYLDGHPQFKATALFASSRSAGKKYSTTEKWTIEAQLPKWASGMRLHETTAKAVADSGVDFVFSALPSDVAGDIETKIAAKGIPVFTNAAAHRMDKGVPLMVPEINADHLELAKRKIKGGGAPIIANANCSTTGLVMGLKPLADIFTIQDVVVSTYQAVTGAGNSGLDLLRQPFNVIPYIKKEEHKMETESRKIMGTLNGSSIKPAKFSIIASCARVWVRDGHLESVVVTVKEKPTLAEVRRAFSKFKSPVAAKKLHTAPRKPIVLFRDEGRPQPALDAWLGESEGLPGMSVGVGQVRVSKDGRIRFFVLSNNTIRGSAGGSVENAELAHAEGLI